MSDLSHSPSNRAFWLSTLGIIGCFLVFAIVLMIAKVPSHVSGGTKPAQMTDEERLELGLLTPDERAERLRELVIKEDHALTSYQWIDKEKGVVRLPIDRAMELVVRDAQAQRR